MELSEQQLAELRKKPKEQLTRAELRYLILHPTDEETKQYLEIFQDDRWLFALNLREMESEEDEPDPD